MHLRTLSSLQFFLRFFHHGRVDVKKPFVHCRTYKRIIYMVCSKVILNYMNNCSTREVFLVPSDIAGCNSVWILSLPQIHLKKTFLFRFWGSILIIFFRVIVSAYPHNSQSIWAQRMTSSKKNYYCIAIYLIWKSASIKYRVESSASFLLLVNWILGHELSGWVGWKLKLAFRIF